MDRPKWKSLILERNTEDVRRAELTNGQGGEFMPKNPRTIRQGLPMRNIR